MLGPYYIAWLDCLAISEQSLLFLEETQGKQATALRINSWDELLGVLGYGEDGGKLGENMNYLSVKIIQLGMVSFFLGIFGVVYLFFSGSDYLIHGLIGITVVPIAIIMLGMLFSRETGYLMLNIIIVPALFLLTYFYELIFSFFLIVFVEAVIFLTRKVDITEITGGKYNRLRLDNSRRQVYVLHGLIPAYILIYVYYLGYENGFFGRASKTISALGSEGILWSAIRFSMWPVLIIVLFLGFVLLMGMLREILESVTLNRRVDDLLDK